MRIEYRSRIAILLLIIFIYTGCNKLVNVPEPANTITTNETFKTEANANSAIVGIYGNLTTSQYGSGTIGRLAALSADELAYFETADAYLLGFQNNAVQAGTASPGINSSLWTPMYFNIYQANAAIEGLEASPYLSGEIKAPLIGEAKYIRAFCHFYLVNLFGDIPLVTTTAYAHVDTMHRTPKNIVYNRIIEDLVGAKNSLPADYASSGNERTRVNKWAAAALLARVYLFTGNYADAEAEASSVINNNGLFHLMSDLDAVFAQDSEEAIWRLQVLNNSTWATMDGNVFIPYSSESSPSFYLTSQLLGAFEPADARRTKWIGSTNYSGTIYYYPFKYKVREGQPDTPIEYYMVLRLAEQYLIRAEARAQQKNNLTGAIGDLNIIRERAGLNDLPATLSQAGVLQAVEQERRIELFSEWGHRWLDLKRTRRTSAVLAPIKPQWKSTQELYPIPIAELQVSPNLTQNEGY